MATVTLVPEDICTERIPVHKQFEAVAALHAHAVAVQTSSDSWTYADLNTAANRFANALVSGGVGPGVPVAVCMNRSAELIAALLGVLKAGAAYLPLLSTDPPERLSRLITDAAVTALITDEENWLKVQRSLTGSEYIVRAEDTLGASAADLSRTGSIDDLACLMYTSGSTGEPKGVMVPHRGIVRLVLQPNYLTISPSDVFLQLAPVSFDASTFEIWGALLNGARLVLPPPGKLSLRELAEIIESSGITTLWLTAGLFSALVDEYPACFRQLNYLLAGGDVLSPTHVRKALRHLPNGFLINGYGPTENTTFTCCHRIQWADTERSSIPIGNPVDDTQVYLLDESGAPVPYGQTGELYTGGSGVALGYWRRSDLTAKAFMPDVFSAHEGACLYRTGDLAYQNEDGTYSFVGRIDGQVKIRGFRVEPAEVEAAVLSHPAVNQAAVLTRVAGSGEKVLCCFYTTASNAGPTPAELLRYLAGTLPDYLQPTEATHLAELPLTANGKVDRQVLAMLGEGGGTQSEPSFEHLTQLEEELLKLLRRTLNCPTITVDDDFFRIGGNSLSAARFFAQIDKKLSKRLPLATMLQAPSVRRLAAIISDDHWQAPWASCVPLQPSGTRFPFFIVHAIGGNIIGYKELAFSLSPEQPVYALQAQGLDGKSSVAQSVEEMAAHYVRGLQSIQEHGPYYLGGWSAGGRVAFEMARQLSAAGEEVAQVVIFDSTIESSSSSLSPAQRFGHLMRWNLYNFRQLGWSTFFRKKLWNLRKHARIVLFEASQRFHFQDEDRQRFNTLQVQDAFLRAIRNYRPGVYAGDVCVFRTKDAKHFSPGDHLLGWQRVVSGRLTFHDVPGNHDTIFQAPNLAVVASKLEQVLAETGRTVAATSKEPASGADASDLTTQKVVLRAITTDRHSTPDMISVLDGRLFSPFLDQVRLRPEHEAVVSGTRRLTYRQLFAAASRLAARLREKGVSPGQLIPVVMSKGWEQIVAVLAVQFTGAAYLPVDAGWPDERRFHLFTTAEAIVALTHPYLATTLPFPDSLLVLPVDTTLLADDVPVPAIPSVPDWKPTDLAYVIFTSGSTGTPKGVMIDHRGALNTILDVNERFQVTSEDRVFALSALSFDLSVYDIFGLLAAGGTIILPESDDKRNPEPWLASLAAERVTIWNTVPALMEMLVSTGGWETAGASLRLALLSGDWIPVSLPERVWKGNSRIQLISLGGATEASIWSVLFPIEAVDPNWGSIPYGRAMKNQGIAVLDEHLQPSPVLVPGEIYIDGIGLAQGYYKNETITRERFLNHPTTGIRLYRTGDWGRTLPNGNIEFLGREDGQVKINGYRIEINEIESVLGRHPAVQSCAIAVLGKRGSGRKLAACVVGPNAHSDELRRYLTLHLPEYMVPHIWKQIDRLPLTANGKIDRQTLCEWVATSLDGFDSEPASSEKESGLEAQVKAIWMRALNLTSLRAEDGFLDLGGDSLSAIQVISDLTANLKAEVPLRLLFDNPDLRTFTAAVTNHQLRETPTP